MMNTLTVNVGAIAAMIIILVLLAAVVIVVHERDPHLKPWFQEHPHWLEELRKHFDD